MRTVHAISKSSLSLPSNSYVYGIKPVGHKLTAISSDDSLRVFDPETLQVDTGRIFASIHDGITCLEIATCKPESVITAGRDGYIRCWDLRNGKKTIELEDDSSSPFLSLAAAPSGYAVAAGTELTQSQATTQIWDCRYPKAPFVRYIESHNDDVTELCYHPTQPSCLLSGSTDGLVNIYDSVIADEEECLIQVFNHGSSIHHAGFLNESTVYALSHDEQLSIYKCCPASEADGSSPSADPFVFGDVRPRISCDYVADILPLDGGALVAAGSHSTSTLDLSDLHLASQWDFHDAKTIRLLEAHSGEIIRTVHADNRVRATSAPYRSLSLLTGKQSSTIYTGGEDGNVAVWKPTTSANDSSHFGPTRHRRKRDSITIMDRHKPY
ncbi:hypothetical protein MMC13_008294 [Lambiella insularis]|nr:hypothetical protein [Lambiella insularis]